MVITYQLLRRIGDVAILVNCAVFLPFLARATIVVEATEE